MKIISHRGNVNGSNIKLENRPDYVENAIILGFDVEVDVWVVGDSVYLGHDNPMYEIDIDFLKNKEIWCHAKNEESLSLMLDCDINCFWHQKDNFTLTSKGFVWCYPGFFHPKGVTVIRESPSICTKYSKKIYGICTDFAEEWRKFYE